MPTIRFKDKWVHLDPVISPPLKVIRPKIKSAYFANATIEEVEVESETQTQQETYPVVSGDTLSKIANKKNTTVAAIIESDPDITEENQNAIYVGQEILLPNEVSSKEKKQKITFEKTSSGSLGKELYVIVETENFREHKDGSPHSITINIKQGKEKCLEEADTALMLKTDQDKYQNYAKTNVGGMCETEYLNKDDFADMAIFKIAIDTSEKEKKDAWIKALEEATDKKTNLYILVDAHESNPKKAGLINYFGDTEEGEIKGEKVANRWLDVDGSWFELKKLDENKIYIKRKWVKWTGKNSSSATFGELEFGNIKGYVCEPYGEETTESGKDKRIPAGTYDLKWHVTSKYPKNKYTLESKFGKKWKLDFPVLKNGVVCIHNDKVPTSRGILLHAGQDGGWTVGCLLPGNTINKDLNKKNIDIKDSVKKLHEILDKIEQLGINNVKLIIRDEIIQN